MALRDEHYDLFRHTELIYIPLVRYMLIFSRSLAQMFCTNLVTHSIQICMSFVYLENMSFWMESKCSRMIKMCFGHLLWR